MLTTPHNFLQELSDLLNENVIDTSVKRVHYFNRAIRRIKRSKKWSWNRLPGTLTLVAGTQIYDLTVQFSNFNPQWGVFEVYLNGVKMTPIDYDRRLNTTSDRFYMKPDGKTIGFTAEIAGDEEIIVWYSPSHTDATAHDTTLDVAIPEDMLGPAALLMKSYLHGGKRQRADQRNALLEYKEELDEVVLQDAQHKIKDLPQNVPTIMTYRGVRRSYNY